MSDYQRQLAYGSGLKAARAGIPKSACNRIRGTIYFDDWMDGYEQGQRNLTITKGDGQ